MKEQRGKRKEERTIQSLRAEAEGKVAQTAGTFPEIKDKTSEELIHELRVHQVELEMQNEELRKAQLALEESRDKYIDLYDFAPVGYFTFTREALIKEVNLTGASLLGVERQKLINGRFRRFVVPEDHEKWDRHLLTVFEPGVVKQVCDLKLRRADGSLFYARLESIRLDFSRGVFLVHTAVSDISERKRAEEGLRESEEQFRTLADSIPNLAWWANADGYITWYNRRWYEYTGTTPEQMEGWGWQSVHDPEVLPKVLERWKASIATGEPFEMEFPLRGADGMFRSFLTRVHTVEGFCRRASSGGSAPIPTSPTSNRRRKNCGSKLLSARRPRRL